MSGWATMTADHPCEADHVFLLAHQSAHASLSGEPLHHLITNDEGEQPVLNTARESAGVGQLTRNR
jgi:nucleoside-diphosphate-sugar epimerase